MPDCDYVENMFCENLEANSDVFRRFRYVHEWAGATISLESIFKKEQMHLHSLNPETAFKSCSVYDGFLDQFAKSIKKYINKIIFNRK